MTGRLINYYEFPNGKIVKHIIDREKPAYDPVSGEWAKVGVFRYLPDSRTWEADPGLTSEFEWDRPRGEVCEHLRSKADLSEDLPALPDLRELSAGSTFCLGAWPQYGDHDWSPVEWLVLEVSDDRALCISAHCLINANYCDLGAALHPTLGTLEDLEALTWQKSLARQKCRDFYEDAFSSEEKDLLLRRKIPAGDIDVYCEDPVFLLSEEEISRLLPSPRQRQAAPTPAVLCGGARCGWNEGDREYTSYWLLPEVRGEGRHSMIYPKAVFHNGEIQYHGRNIYHMDFTIRPCILLKVQ